MKNALPGKRLILNLSYASIRKQGRKKDNEPPAAGIIKTMNGNSSGGGIISNRKRGTIWAVAPLNRGAFCGGMERHFTSLTGGFAEQRLPS